MNPDRLDNMEKRLQTLLLEIQRQGNQVQSLSGNIVRLEDRVQELESLVTKLVVKG